MADEKKKEDVDPRLEYISSYVTKTFRIKSDKWQKLITSEEKVIKVWFPLETLKTNFPTLSLERHIRLAG